jgi:hypothetical protein
MKQRFCTLIGVAGCAVLTGCGGGGPSFSTGSLFGSAQPAVAAAPPVETASMRAAHVGAVSARATKCGYNFDPARLKAGFLASEGQKGASAEELGRVEREFDTIRVKVAARISVEPEFCTDAKTREIKADLTRHLAGDYAAPVNQQKVIDERLLASAPKTREVINPDFMTDKYAPKTKRVEQ